MTGNEVYEIENHRITGIKLPDGTVRPQLLSPGLAEMVNALLLKAIEDNRKVQDFSLNESPTEQEAFAAASAITDQLSLAIGNLIISHITSGMRPEEIAAHPDYLAATINDALTPRPKAQWHYPPADKQDMICEVAAWNGLHLALKWKDGSIDIAPRSEVETFW